MASRVRKLEEKVNVLMERLDKSESVLNLNENVTDVMDKYAEIHRYIIRQSQYYEEALLQQKSFFKLLKDVNKTLLHVKSIVSMAEANKTL